MPQRLFLFVLLGATFLLGACQDVVELDVPDSPPEAVINGFISDTHPALVTISTTDAFFEANRTPRVANAEVRLFKNDSLLEVLEPNPVVEGEYLGQSEGELGQRYHLEILIPEGFPGKVSGCFETKPETLKPVSQIDSMNIQALDRTTTPRAFQAGDYALLYFQERPGVGDFFRINRWLNDSLFRRDIFVLDDENFDGLYYGGDLLPPFPIFGPFEEFVEPNASQADTFRVRFESVSAEYASFLQLIDEQTSVGTPFDAPPALIIGNVYRQGNPQDYAFGYFYASAYSEDSVIRIP